MAGRAHSVEELLIDRNNPTGSLIKKKHTLWTLLDPQIVEAQGFTTVLRTTSGGGHGPIPLQFDVHWKQQGSPPDAPPMTSIAKPHNLFFAGETSLGPAVGQATSAWKARLHEALDAFTWNEADAQSKLKNWRRRHSSIHQEVKAALPGDLIEVNGTRAVVVSCTAIQTMHPYGSMLVAPLRPTGTAAKEACAIPWKGERIAFEEVQSCEPIEGFHAMQRLGSVGSSLERVYEGLTHLTLLSGPKPVTRLSTDALVRYLSAAKHDRGGAVPTLVLPHVISGPVPVNVWPPKITATPKHRGATDTSRELLVAERFDGYHGALRLEFWHVARQIVLRIVAERGQITKLSQVGFGPLDGDRTALFEDMPLDGWTWETPIGALEDLDRRTLSLHVIADGHAITAEPSFSMNQPGS